MYKFIGIIPARFASTRFLGKPLCDIRGKSMIRRVYERAIRWEKFNKVYIATDSDLIANECDIHDIPYIMTSDKHSDCLDRAWEASHRLEEDGIGAKKYVIIQGDEPLFDVRTLDVKYDAPCINFFTKSVIDVYDVNAVKVVISNNKRALYFSRFPIPSFNADTRRSDCHVLPVYKQIGVYVFTGEMLKLYHDLGLSPLEDAEGVGLNRLLENDVDVIMKYTKYDSISVDTQQDKNKVERILIRNENKNGQ